MADSIRCPNCGSYTGKKLHSMPILVALFLGIFPGMVVGLPFALLIYVGDKVRTANNPYYQGNGFECYTCKYKWIMINGRQANPALLGGSAKGKPMRARIGCLLMLCLPIGAIIAGSGAGLSNILYSNLDTPPVLFLKVLGIALVVIGAIATAIIGIGAAIESLGG